MQRFIYILFILSSVTLSAQVEYFSDSDLIKGNANEKYIESVIDVSNFNSTDLNFYWEVERENVPAEWDFQVCDQNICYNFGIEECPDNLANNLRSGDNAELRLRLRPNGVSANGAVTLHLVSNDKSIKAIPVTFHVNNKEDKSDNIDLNIYPNPSDGFIQIQNDKEVKKIYLVNVVGKKVKTLDHKPGKSHYIYDLDNGYYFAKLINASNQLIKVIRLTKK